MNVTCINVCFYVCGLKNKFVRLDKKSSCHYCIYITDSNTVHCMC